MFLFLILLFPTVLCFCCFHSTKKIYGFLVAAGAFLGILASGATALFSYMHRIPEFSVCSNFFYYFLKEYVLPLILVYALYFFTTKDSVEFKIKAFFPVAAAFYAIYMPYCVIASSSAAFSFFQLFAKPVLMLSEVFMASFFAYRIYCAAVSKDISRIIVLSFFAVVMLVIPPALETMYLLCIALPVVYIIAVIFALFALVLFFINSRKDDGFIYLG